MCGEVDRQVCLAGLKLEICSRQIFQQWSWVFWMFRPSTVQISRWWDYFQSFNDPQICSVDVGSHVRVGSSVIVVWNLPHLQNWWTAARATQEIIEKAGSIPIVRFTTNPKENQLSSSLWRVLKPFDAYENLHSQTKFIRRRTSFSY